MLQARASLGSEWDFAAYDDCLAETGPRSTSTSPVTAFSLHPNPAQEGTLLQLGATVTTGQAILRDLNGRILGEWRLDGQQQVQLQWTDRILAGLYLLEVMTDQNPPQMLKLRVQKP